jgi:dihydrofolate synthase / folylpolyglutamate synthase
VNYPEALAWLYSLQRFGIKLGLENTRRLIDSLHVDLASARVIHVAGTNGKGSVCAMIDSIARAAGYRSGLFTSPHLVTFRERVRIDGKMISERAVATGLTAIQNLVANWEPHPTFFEITTALALKYFSEAKIDIVILETGLGGRLDATNAVPSNVAVITAIDLDHQQWLGDSIEKIASEKAGIIKPKTPVISGPQRSEVEKIIRTRAAECDAPMQFVNESYEQSPLALRGAHQKQNAALAIAALRTAKIDIDELAIAHGLMSVEWPARFQLWDKRTVIDGAHNPAAARILAENWREVFGDKRATLILAILSDKDLRGICQALAPISDHVFLPKIRSERAADPKQLAQIFSNITPPLPCSVSDSIADAFDSARARPSPILVTGSLHFAGEVLAHLQARPAAFEECAQ